MSDDLHAQLLAAFREEYREHIDGIRTALASEPIGPANWDEAFRHAHSLKAAARVCDLAPLADVGQRLESLFSRGRQGGSALPAAAVGVALRAIDVIENWARVWEGGASAPDSPPVLEEVDRLLGSPSREETQPKAEREKSISPPEVGRTPGSRAEELDAEVLAAFQVEHREHLEGIRALLAQIEMSGGAPGQVEEAFRRAHSLKGAARIAGLRSAETVAHRLETLFAQGREGTLSLTPELVQTIQRGLNFIEDAAVCLLQARPAPDPTAELAAIDAALGMEDAGSAARSDDSPKPLVMPEDASATAPARSAHADDAVRVSADQLDRLLQSADQILTEGLSQDRSLRELAGLQRAAEELLREWESAGTALGSLRQLAGTPDLVRISRALYHVGDQMRALVRRTRQTHRLQRQSSWSLRALGRQLQHDVRQARTVPAESIFQGFRKMMRDLAQAEGKEIDFRVNGLEVKADRLVLQALKDPLMHVLRNAVCHGIESPAERLDHGKERAGRVTLDLQVVGNHLHVRVEDDGRGINPRKLAEEAVRRHVLIEAEAAKASDEELIRLAFRAGFSTARVITDLSGRGMGLSVVQEGITRLQGEVSLSRGPHGAGTRIRILVPLSVSAQRLLLVSSRGQILAIPAHGVERLQRIKPTAFETLGGQSVLQVEDEPIPVGTLAQILGIDGADVAPSALLPVVVVRSGGRRLAVIVDALLGERDALIKDLGPPAGRGDRWAGGILLEDGAVCLVLNPAALFRTESRPTGNPAAPAAGKTPTSVVRPAEKKTPTILVVDDSLTTRTLEKSILEAHGYRVRIALDGIEALSQLRSDLPDLVITDIQMPRLDGFGLLEQMKKDARLARIPVIVVTSLEKRADQERGLALGADAYIVKRKFDHEELLQTVRQIL